MAIWAIAVVGAFSLLLSAIFVRLAILPYFQAKRSIEQLQRELESAKEGEGRRTLMEVESNLGMPAPLRSSLSQFQGSLAGRNHPIGAEAYLGNASVVYLILNSELVRHLPGLATATGIIGTFLGLIGGLYKYNPNISETVADLVKEVRFAFFGSMLAIIVALVVTASDKWFTNQLAQRLHALAAQLDRLFPIKPVEVQLLEKLDALTGESTRVYESVERGNRQLEAAQAGTFHRLEALTGSLSDGFRSLETAVESSTETILKDGFASQADAIRDGIVNVLRAPLDAVQAAIQSTAQSTNDGVQQLLTTVLSDFQQQLDQTFGDQIQSITASNVKAAETLEDARLAVSQLVRQIAETQTRGAETVENTLRGTMESIQSNQKDMMAAMQQTVAAMAASSEAAVGRSNQAGEDAAARISDQLGAAIQTMEATIRTASETATQSQAESLRIVSDSQTALAERITQSAANATEASQKAVGETMAAVNQLQQSVVQTVDQMTNVVASLRKVQTEAFDAMNSGAAGVRTAFGQFEGSTKSLEAAITEFTPALTQLRAVTSALDSSVNSFTSISQRQADTQRVAEETSRILSGAVGSANQVANSLRENAETISSLLSQVRTLSAEVSTHSQRISLAMQSGMDAFGEKMIAQTNRVFQISVSELNKALWSLSTAMDEMASQLADALDQDQE